MVPITVIKSLIAKFTIKTCCTECNFFTRKTVDTKTTLHIVDATIINENDIAVNVAKAGLNECPNGTATICGTVGLGNPVEFK